MEKQKKNDSGITLVALVVSIIVMLVLAGVSLNATIGDNGIVTRAQEAKLAYELAQEKEEIETMMADFNINGDTDITSLDSFLDSQCVTTKDGTNGKGVIDGYLVTFKLEDGSTRIIMQKGDHYYDVIQDGEYWYATLTDDDVNGGSSGSGGTKVSVVSSNNFDPAKDGTYEIDNGENSSSDIIFYDFITGNLNFEIKSGTVTIYLTNSMELTNNGMSRSAIDIYPGATLKLYIAEGKELLVDSGYGQSGATANGFGAEGGPGGYAGIHVPEGATFNVYGKGTLIAKGGKAGFGAGAVSGNTGGGAGGGGGAGIGGHGGKGGNGNSEHNTSNKRYTNCGTAGEKGENCGEVNIYNNITVYAYGGASGGSLKSSNTNSGCGGGGYPGAGIGGGGAGGGGADSCHGGGGYTGGGGETLSDETNNGEGGTGTSFDGGAGYWSKGKITSERNYKENVVGGQGGASGCSVENGGDGGIGGEGGIIKVSKNASIYAYNGNRFTDGTDYNAGANQTPIYAQRGKLLAIYKGNYYWEYDKYTTLSSLQSLLKCTLEITENLTDNTKYPVNNYLIRKAGNCSLSGYENPLFKAKSVAERSIAIEIDGVSTTIDMINQGVGSGAGYIEVSNGTYTRYNEDNNSNFTTVYTES